MTTLPLLGRQPTRWSQATSRQGLQSRLWKFTGALSATSWARSNTSMFLNLKKRALIPKHKTKYLFRLTVISSDPTFTMHGQTNDTVEFPEHVTMYLYKTLCKWIHVNHIQALHAPTQVNSADPHNSVKESSVLEFTSFPIPYRNFLMVFSKKSCKLAKTSWVVLNPHEASGIPENSLKL